MTYNEAIDREEELLAATSRIIDAVAHLSGHGDGRALLKAAANKIKVEYDPTVFYRDHWYADSLLEALETTKTTWSALKSWLRVLRLEAPVGAYWRITFELARLVGQQEIERSVNFLLKEAFCVYRAVNK